MISDHAAIECAHRILRAVTTEVTEDMVRLAAGIIQNTARREQNDDAMRRCIRNASAELRRRT